MNINPLGFLWLKEEKLVLFLIKAQEEAIAWDPTESGNFRKDYFKLIIIPTVTHTHGLSTTFLYHLEYMMRSSG